MRKFLLFPCIIFMLAVINYSCGSDNDDDPKIQEEQDRYNEFVTPELEDVLVNVLGVDIHRGIYPPNMQGFYRMKTYCSKSTIAGDSWVGTVMNNFKMKFHDQQGLNISMDGFEVVSGTNIYINEHISEGTFICGNGDSFSIFFNEEVKSSKDECTTFTVLSGSLDRDVNGTIIGINNFQYVLLMRENNGYTSLIANGEGRLFKDDSVKVISEEEFNTITNRPKSESTDTDTVEGLSLLSK